MSWFAGPLRLRVWRPLLPTFLLSLCWAAPCSALGAPAPAAGAPAPTWQARPLWTRATGLGVLNEPFCADLDYDGALDIVISNKQGEVWALDAATGKTLWRVRVPGGPILSPLSGSFLERGRPEIALVHQDGGLHVLRGADGQIVFDGLLEATAGERPALFKQDGAVLPAPDSPYGDDATSSSVVRHSSLARRAARGQGDSIVLLDESRRLHRFHVGEARRFTDVWRGLAIAAVGDLTNQPPALGPLGPGRDDALVALASAGGRVLAGFARSPDAPLALGALAPGVSAPDGQILLQFDSQPFVRSVFITSETGLSAFAVDGEGGSLAPIAGAGAGVYVKEHGAPLSVPDATGDGVNDILLHGLTQVVLVDGATGAAVAPPAPYPVGVGYLQSQGAAFRSAERVPRTFAVFANSIRQLEILDVARPSEVVRSQAVSGANLGPTSPLVLDAAGASEQGLAAVFVQCEDATVLTIATDLPLARGEAAWPGSRGGALRSGGVPPGYSQAMRQHQEDVRASMANGVAAARTLLRDGRYDAAMLRLDDALSLNPRYGDALRLRRTAWWGLHRFQAILLTLAAAALFAVYVILLRRRRAIQTLMLEADAMVSAGRHDALVRAFADYASRHWHPYPILARFARICREIGLVPSGMTAVFEKCFRKRPDDADIIGVLAELYLADRCAEEKTIAVYDRARRATAQRADATAAAHAAAFAEILGVIYCRAGRFDLGRPLLEEALQHGVRTTDLFDALARVYLDAGLIKPRYIPIFEQALAAQPADPALLDGLARCYVVARMQRDPRAWDVFQRLAAAQPGSVVANVEVATHCYWAGEFDRAEESAREVLRTQPENRAAVQVLAWCLWRRKDLAPDAQTIYRHALAQHPGDSFLLRAVGEADLELPAPTPEAAEHLVRAMEHNANDSGFLARVAASGMRWHTAGQTLGADLARQALERLACLEMLTDEQVLFLTRTYLGAAAQGADGLLACPLAADAQVADVLLRAFALEPRMPGLAPLLGATLVRQGRHDAQAEDVLTTLVRTDSDQPLWAVQLARVHMAREHYRAMSAVLYACVARHPDLGVASAPGESSGAGSTSSSLSIRAQVQRLLAVAHSNLQEFSQAVDHYRALLESTPDDPQAIIGLGQAYARMDILRDDADAQSVNHTEAMYEAIGRARDLAPDDPLLNLATAEHLAERGRWDAATTCLVTALRGGDEYQAQALNLIAALVRRYPGETSVPARWARARVLAALERNEEVVEETEIIGALDATEHTRILAFFHEILQKDSKNVEILFARGRVLARLGRAPLARRSLEEALRLRPDYQPALRVVLDVYEAILKTEETPALHFALAQVAMQLQDYDRAVAGLQHARADARYERQARRLLAECFLEKGMLDLAMQEFLSVPSDSQVRPLVYRLGEEFEKAGNLIGARMAYQQVYSADARYRDVAERLKTLANASAANPDLMALVRGGGGTLGSGTASGQTGADLGDLARTRYDLHDEIGRGAMASVYRAYDKELEETVALKVLPENLLRNPEALRRFRQEARAARHLAHENIVRIHDIGEERGRKYISMELVTGESLKDRLKRRQLEAADSGPWGLAPGEILSVARQVAGAMRYAHQMGVIHRDLKPANILITEDGKAKVADFGIAKTIEIVEDQQKTMTGAVIGTPLYMSPEQVLGRPCDARTDIYSYGIMLYEMTSGHTPFREGDLAYQHLHGEPPPLSASVDPVLAQVILKCLAKDPADRWQDFDEILRELDQAKGDSVPGV